MQGSTTDVCSTGFRSAGSEGGFSLVMVEKILSLAQKKGISPLWSDLNIGRPSKRVTSYSPQERIMSVMAGLACGMKGIATGNLLLRTNSAVRELFGGRFADQGTIHRWLAAVTPEQTLELRKHLRSVVARHGEFWKELQSDRRLFIDIDAQGIVARGERYREAQFGHLGEGMDRGYQRYVCYVGLTKETLDEMTTPGNTTLMGELPQMVEGLNEIFDLSVRERIVLRVDAHGGTAANLHAMQQSGYHYLTRMQSQSAVKRLRKHATSRSGETFESTDSAGHVHHVEYWDAPEWTLCGNQQHIVQTRAVLFHEVYPSGNEFWWVLLSDLTSAPEVLWNDYHQRGGTIEEYNDQSEQAYHLKTVRTGHLPGLGALHALVGLCWNLTQWSIADLELPPKISPQAPPARHIRSQQMSLRELLDRASHCGLKLFRQRHQRQLEVEDTVQTPESRRWLQWLHQPIQKRLHLTI